MTADPRNGLCVKVKAHSWVVCFGYGVAYQLCPIRSTCLLMWKWEALNFMFLDPYPARFGGISKVSNDYES